MIALDEFAPFMQNNIPSNLFNTQKTACLGRNYNFL